MENELNTEKEGKIKSRFDKYIIKENLIIKDSTFFKDDTPPKMVERKEIDDFYRELGVLVNYRKPNSILWKCYPGSGKTVTINFVKEVLEQEKKDIEVFIINCYGKSSYDILKNLSEGVTQVSIQNLVERFLKQLKKDCIIFLDEIDRSNRIDDLLYLLSRPKEIVKDFDKNINLVLVSNNFAWQESLPDKIRSSLQLKNIIFRSYKANDIKNILNQRIKWGFFERSSISDELVDTISHRVEIERKGDCRVALDVIFYAALEAEREGQKQISEKHVEKALSIAVNNRDKQIISKLKDEQLLTLLAVCFNNIGSLEDLHKKYTDIIISNKLAVKTKSKIMIFHMLNHLTDLGLVDKNIEVTMEKNLQRRTLNAKCRINKVAVIDELNIRGLRLTDNYEK